MAWKTKQNLYTIPGLFYCINTICKKNDVTYIKFHHLIDTLFVSVH